MAGGFAVHADHEAARNNAGETAGLDPRPDFVPTGCPNCPRCHSPPGNAFKTLRFAVVDLGHRDVGICRCCPKRGSPSRLKRVRGLQALLTVALLPSIRKEGTV